MLHSFSKCPLGFTLAELLITLLILGEIATFTIPKIITSQANIRYNAITKEVASAIAGAYQQNLHTNGISSNDGIATLTSYLNYVSVDTTSIINAGSYDCGGGSQNICLVLHSGAYLAYNPAAYFSGTNTTNAVWFAVDPSGPNDNIASTRFLVTFNGRILSYADVDRTYTYKINGGGTVNVSSGSTNPSWFYW
jgi:prepilin-type N-terminal cleavage/methylation domain-containing protein